MDPTSLQSFGDGHILISGTGRAGTTLLVKYFTLLGFDTGFSADDIARTSVGLERVATEEPLPYVIKSPLYTETIGTCLTRGSLRIKCCVIPVRRLFDAAESRRRIHRESLGTGLGTIWMTDDPNEQEAVLTRQFYKLVEALVCHGVPMHFLYFPAFAESAEDLYDGLKPILEEHGISRESSDSAHRALVDLRLVHRFSPGKAGSP
jgi:hypothetical protein